MSTEALPQEEEKTRTNLMHSYALSVKEGKAGGQYCYCLEDDRFYYYHDGYWEALFTIDFLARLEENMKKITRYSVSTRNQIGENFKRLGRKKLDEFNCQELINLKNYMLDPIGLNVLNHDPLFYSTNQLPYNYDKNADCPLWIKSLNEIFEDNQEKIGIVQEFSGYCLTRNTSQQKALLFSGESKSGKSTILHIIERLIGIKNCSNVPLKYITKPEYTVRLINKLVNIDREVSEKATEFESEFKTITSGEPIQGKILYSDAFDFVPCCKFLMSCNKFPKIADHSSAFYNRLIIIPCERVFVPEEQNRLLKKQIESELSGILNWAIEGLKRLNKRGMFEELNFVKEAVQELEDENNPVNEFFDEHIVVDVQGGDTVYIEKSELFEKYKNWCERSKNYTLSKARFSFCVYKKYHKETPKDSRLSKNGSRIWRNIRHVENKMSEPVKQAVDWND